MFNKRQLTEDSIKNMLQINKSAKGIQESTTVDFKSDLSKDKILISICAMANTIGGKIFVGVKEENGFAVELVGFESPGGDPKTWFSNIISSSIYPTPEVSIEVLNFKENLFVCIIEVQKSNLSPHVIVSKSVNETDREKVFWRYNDMSHRAPFYIVEQMFQRRNVSTAIQSNSIFSYSGLDDGALLSIKICPKYNSSELLLDNKHMNALKAFLIENQNPTECASGEHKKSFSYPDGTENKLILKIGKLRPEIKQSENYIPENTGLLWWTSASVWKSGVFEYRTSLPHNENLIGADFICASIIYASKMAAHMEPSLKHKQLIKYEIKIPPTIQYLVKTVFLKNTTVKEFEANELATKPYYDHPLVLSNVREIDVFYDNDIVTLLTEVLTQIGNYFLGGKPRSVQDWEKIAKQLLEINLETTVFGA